jgi:hypothetical protein
VLVETQGKFWMESPRESQSSLPWMKLSVFPNMLHEPDRPTSWLAWHRKETDSPKKPEKI